MELGRYMEPHERDMPFSGCHGNNLTKTTNFEMKWDQRCHDGVCVSSRPIRKGDRYKILITGDGHVLVGLINKLPSSKDLHSGRLSLKAADLAVYQVRIKKFSSTVHVEYVEKKKITLQDGNGSSLYHRTVKEKESCYLCVELLFGNVEVALTSVVPTNNKTEDLLWSTKSGLNLLRSPNGSKMTLKHTNPLSLCGSHIPLQAYKTVKLMVDILPNCQYGYLSFAVSNRQPENLHLNCPNKFYSDEILPHLSDFKKIKVKESSDICIVWDGGRNIKYFIMNKEEKEVQINNVDITFPLYLIIEMFRIHVSIATVQAMRPPVTMVTQKQLPVVQPITGNSTTSSLGSFHLFQDPITQERNNFIDNGYLRVIPDPSYIGISVSARSCQEKTTFHLQSDNTQDGNRAELANQLQCQSERKQISEIGRKQTQVDNASEEFFDPLTYVPNTSNTYSGSSSIDDIVRSLAMKFNDDKDPLIPDMPAVLDSLKPRQTIGRAPQKLCESDIQTGKDEMTSRSSTTSYDIFGYGKSRQVGTSSQQIEGIKSDVEKRLPPQDINRRVPSLALDIDFCQNPFTEEEWLETLQSHQSYLQERMNPLPVAHILHKEHYISVREYSTLETMTCPNEQTLYLINLLKKRPHLSHQVLRALERAGQRRVAEYLVMAF